MLVDTVEIEDFECALKLQLDYNKSAVMPSRCGERYAIEVAGTQNKVGQIETSDNTRIVVKKPKLLRFGKVSERIMLEIPFIIKEDKKDGKSLTLDINEAVNNDNSELYDGVIIFAETLAVLNSVDKFNVITRDKRSLVHMLKNMNIKETQVNNPENKYPVTLSKSKQDLKLHWFESDYRGLYREAQSKEPSVLVDKIGEIIISHEKE